MKHLLYEQQNSLSELKAEGVVSTKLLQKEHADLETQLHKDLRSLKVELKEQELSSENVLKSLQLVCKYLEFTLLYSTVIVITILLIYIYLSSNRNMMKKQLI